MAMKTPRSVATPIEPNFTWAAALGGEVAVAAGETAVGELPRGAELAAGALAGTGAAAGALAGAAQAASRSRPARTLQRPEVTIARISALPSRGRRAAAQSRQQAAVGQRARVRAPQVQLLAEVQRQLLRPLALDHAAILRDDLLDDLAEHRVGLVKAEVAGGPGEASHPSLGQRRRDDRDELALALGHRRDRLPREGGDHAVVPPPASERLHLGQRRGPRELLAGERRELGLEEQLVAALLDGEVGEAGTVRAGVQAGVDEGKVRRVDEILDHPRRAGLP